MVLAYLLGPKPFLSLLAKKAALWEYGIGKIRNMPGKSQCRINEIHPLNADQILQADITVTAIQHGGASSVRRLGLHIKPVNQAGICQTRCQDWILIAHCTGCCIRLVATDIAIRVCIVDIGCNYS